MYSSNNAATCPKLTFIILFRQHNSKSFIIIVSVNIFFLLFIVKTGLKMYFQKSCSVCIRTKKCMSIWGVNDDRILIFW